MSATFEPVTLADVKSALGRLIPGGIDSAAARLAEHPFRNTASLVGLTTMLFYMAERGYNPKVKSIFDASIYCSTCLNVGYGDIYAVTPVGKLIGTMLMTVGPGLVTKVTDGAGSAQASATQQKIADTLQEILAQLQISSPTSL